jgi:DnaJ-class molecular chaperone
MYDQFGEAGSQQGHQHGRGPGGFHFQHGDPFNIFETVFGGGMGGGQNVRFQFGSGMPGGWQNVHFNQHHQQQHHQQQQQQTESLYKDDALIQELDEDTFPDGDGEGWIWVVELYAPWW